VRFDQDQNSVFDQTGFATQVRRDGLQRLWIGGLALDVCVLATVLDGLREGFAMQVIQNGTKPVDVAGQDKVLQQMTEAGAVIVRE